MFSGVTFDVSPPCIFVIDDEIELEMNLSIKNFQEEHLVKEKIKIK